MPETTSTHIRFVPGESQRAFADLERLLLAPIRPAWAIVDAHTHLGHDEDGRALRPDQLLSEMDRHGVQQAVVCPFFDPQREPSYRRPNRQILGWARSETRFVPFIRLLAEPGVGREFERARANGARGIKLHPRADRFQLADPSLRPVFRMAAAERLPVLIHAGPGIEPLAAELEEVLTHSPDSIVILAHAGISDQAPLAELSRRFDGVYFDTSVWNPSDVISLLTRVRPERVLFGSDTPYGSISAELPMVTGLLHWLSASPAQTASVLGGTLSTLLRAETPPRSSAGPLPTPQLPFEPDLHRLGSYLSTAAWLAWAGHRDAVGLVELSLRIVASSDSLSVLERPLVSAAVLWRAALTCENVDGRSSALHEVWTTLHLAQTVAFTSIPLASLGEQIVR